MLRDFGTVAMLQIFFCRRKVKVWFLSRPKYLEIFRGAFCCYTVGLSVYFSFLERQTKGDPYVCSVLPAPL